MQFALALAEVLHLDPTLFHQGLETEIDATKTDAQFFGQYTLTDLWSLLQATKDFQLNFLLETS